MSDVIELRTIEDTDIKRGQLEAISAAGVKIPPCPQVLADLQQVLQDPNSDNKALARLIGRDIKLAAAVFKTSNSAACARSGKKFTTMDQAVAVLGRQAIGNIARIAALQLSLASPDPRLVRFWERSMEIAMLCSIVVEQAPNAGGLSSEQAFTAGLFHDCGVAVLMQHYRAYGHAFANKTQPLPDILDQDDTYCTSHCLVGQMVAKEWNLPEFVFETIGAHHLPLAKVPKAGITATAALSMSMHILNVKQRADDATWAKQRLPVISVLGLLDNAVDVFERNVWSSFEMLH